MGVLLTAHRASAPRLFDGFCGAGGSSLGCRWAGVEVTLAINHNQDSLRTHERNFPAARHDCVDITAIPFESLQTFPDAEIAWFSSECTFHSTASGETLRHQRQLPLWTDLDEQPHIARSRATMREVIRWGQARRAQGKPYVAIVVENVPKVMLWSGIEQWYQDLDALGYRRQTICFNSMFAQATFPEALAERVYPVAQSRDRWYTVCTLKENPTPDLDLRPRGVCPACAREVEAIQTWKPCATGRHWGGYGTQYLYRCPRCHSELTPFFTPASALVDWSLPMERIGDRRAPLAETTLQRIEKGLVRFCRGEQPSPFLVDVSHTKSESAYVRSIWEPGFTQTQAQTAGLVVPVGAPEPPFIFHTLRTHDEVERELAVAIKRRDRTPKRRRWSDEEKAAFIAATWSDYHTQVERYQQELPMFQRSYRQHPTPPVQAQRAFLASYYGQSDVLIDMDEAVRTCTQVDRHGLVIAPETTSGAAPAVEDCLYRMLKSKEVKRAMGIPESYEIVAISQREETRQCGLAVTPAVATLILHRVLPTLGESVVLQTA